MQTRSHYNVTPDVQDSNNVHNRHGSKKIKRLLLKQSRPHPYTHINPPSTHTCTLYKQHESNICCIRHAQPHHNMTHTTLHTGPRCWSWKTMTFSVFERIRMLECFAVIISKWTGLSQTDFICSITEYYTTRHKQNKWLLQYFAGDKNRGGFLNSTNQIKPYNISKNLYISVNIHTISPFSFFKTMYFKTVFIKSLKGRVHPKM